MLPKYTTISALLTAGPGVKMEVCVLSAPGVLKLPIWAQTSHTNQGRKGLMKGEGNPNYRRYRNAQA